MWILVGKKRAGGKEDRERRSGERRKRKRGKENRGTLAFGSFPGSVVLVVAVVVVGVFIGP